MGIIARMFGREPCQKRDRPYPTMIGSEGYCDNCGCYSYLRGGWCSDCCREIGVPFRWNGNDMSVEGIEKFRPKIIPPKSGTAARKIDHYFSIGEWSCQYCDTLNQSVNRCVECGAPRQKKKLYFIDVGQLSRREALKVVEEAKKQVKIIGPDKPVV